MTLLRLLRRLGIVRKDTREQERLARLDAVRAALARLDRRTTADTADAGIEELRARYTSRARRLEAGDEDRSSEALGRVHEPRYLALRLELLDAERSAAGSSCLAHWSVRGSSLLLIR
ncbi:hypothetical protein MSM1_00235 [Mycobacterium sp. SM1]|uniref:hypothetical protein n=1 Tax=Mycobacterium sp. SM1 TaxID=2816243 RepID=UPI001BCED051|nr:hypothetical protein [Mycobacterium sp. SM1]MBS4726863.1 hypothetical protein [Mycobacterium sp. SM1]